MGCGGRGCPGSSRNGPGQGHRVEGGVGHGVTHPAPDDVVPAAVDLAPLDDPVPEGGVEVPGEGVEGLVVVVVGVEDRVVEILESGMDCLLAVAPRAIAILRGGRSAGADGRTGAAGGYWSLAQPPELGRRGAERLG